MGDTEEGWQVGVKSFIRDTLGCTCPEEVFERIDSRRQVALGGVILSRRIDVGHRLLVYLLECDDLDYLRARLSEIIGLGLAERDQGGFNRLRIVVATDNSEPMSAPARRVFESVRGRDERLHLHLVDKAAVEGL